MMSCHGPPVTSGGCGRQMGGCFASDRITVDGARVGYMYREAPDFPKDSGWRLLAGDESDEYMDDADQHGVY